MANEEESTKARFGWNHASEVKIEDEEGNIVWSGETPPEIQKILDKHAEEVNKANKKKTDDARRPKIKLHVHRR